MRISDWSSDVCSSDLEGKEGGTWTSSSSGRASGGAESAADLAPAGGSLASPTKFCTPWCTRGTSPVALRQMLRTSHISVVIEPMAPTTLVINLGLVPRAHPASLPSHCREVRRKLLAWTAGAYSEVKVLGTGRSAGRERG